MPDVAVPKVSLQSASVVPTVGQGVAAGVPEHVRVGFEAQLGCGTRALDHAGKPSRREWRAPFRREHERRFWFLFALESPQMADFGCRTDGRRNSASREILTRGPCFTLSTAIVVSVESTSLTLHFVSIGMPSVEFCRLVRHTFFGQY